MNFSTLLPVSHFAHVQARTFGTTVTKQHIQIECSALETGVSAFTNIRTLTNNIEMSFGLHLQILVYDSRTKIATIEM